MLCLDVREVHELGLCDGLVCLPEHALLEQQLAGGKVLLLVGAQLVHHIRNVLVVIQQQVLVCQRLTELAFAGKGLHVNSECM